MEKVSGLDEDRTIRSAKRVYSSVTFSVTKLLPTVTFYEKVTVSKMRRCHLLEKVTRK